MGRVSVGMMRASIIAAAYVALTFVTGSLAYTPLQFRLSEVLMPLPYKRRFGRDAVVGLTVGGFLAELISPYGIFDVVLGTITNLVAGILAYMAGLRFEGRCVGRMLAVLASIASVAFFIGFVLLHLVYEVPFIESVVYIALSESLTAGIGGYLLLEALDRRMPGK